MPYGDLPMYPGLDALYTRGVISKEGILAQMDFPSAELMSSGDVLTLTSTFTLGPAGLAAEEEETAVADLEANLEALRSRLRDPHGPYSR